MRWTTTGMRISPALESRLKTFRENNDKVGHPMEQIYIPSGRSLYSYLPGYLVSRGTRFVLTTHSPYVLYAINNFMMASKAVVAQRELIADQADEVAIPPERVAAYRFAPDGNANSIMAGDVGLIDENELDQVADDLGTAFTTMQEQLESAT